MIFPQPIPVRELAARLGAQLLGDESLEATGINELHHCQPGDIIFADVRKYFNKALRAPATIILLNEPTDPPPGKAVLVVPDPFAAYNGLVWAHRPFRPLTAEVSVSALIGEGTIIEPGAVVGHEVVIGKDCYIQATAYVGDGSVLGDRVVIQPGAIIGSDAFYYKKTPDGFLKWRSGGRVVIEDDVEIGAGCTINRGVSSDTVIGAGTKLDCKVQIGHDTKVGRRCLFAAQVGVAGNTLIGDEVVLYGQVGVTQNLRIGNRVVVLAQSGVATDLEAGKTYFGSPARESREAFREIVALRRLVQGS